ncbi:hypothetical protein RHS04_06536 [Rhizoctonia solani]|uniref:Uncharacterized protein n=1 Tax=Rhizoctonia solani TaxID=456999 RepID=A0A8H7H7K1_9AGAM|nr:hypothetical protein RHS04_06536 [Rhizoctonia solani]
MEYTIFPPLAEAVSPSKEPLAPVAGPNDDAYNRSRLWGYRACRTGAICTAAPSLLRTPAYVSGLRRRVVLTSRFQLTPRFVPGAVPEGPPM